MATRLSDAHDRPRVMSRSADTAPYAGQGAGLYSEVRLAAAPGPRRQTRPIVEDDRAGPIA